MVLKDDSTDLIGLSAIGQIDHLLESHDEPTITS
jgi:hypothetical protein